MSVLRILVKVRHALMEVQGTLTKVPPILINLRRIPMEVQSILIREQRIHIKVRRIPMEDRCILIRVRHIRIVAASRLGPAKPLMAYCRKGGDALPGGGPPGRWT